MSNGVDLIAQSQLNSYNRMIELYRVKPRMNRHVKYLPNISHKIKPITAVIVLSRVALQFAGDEDVAPVIALPVVLFQLVT